MSNTLSSRVTANTSLNFRERWQTFRRQPRASSAVWHDARSATPDESTNETFCKLTTTVRDPVSIAVVVARRRAAPESAAVNTPLTESTVVDPSTRDVTIGR